MKKFIKIMAYPITLIIGIIVGFAACLELSARAGILDDKDDVEYCGYDDLDCMSGINDTPHYEDIDIDVE